MPSTEIMQYYVHTITPKPTFLITLSHQPMPTAHITLILYSLSDITLVTNIHDYTTVQDFITIYIIIIGAKPQQL